MSTYTIYRPKPQGTAAHINAVRARVLRAIEQDKALLAEFGLLDAFGHWRALPRHSMNHEKPSWN